MIWHPQWLDVRPHLAAGRQPVVLVERPLLHGQSAKGGVFGIAEVARLGTYWVPNADVITTDGGWQFTKSGAHVHVPVIAYRTPERALSSIWALGLQLGMAAIESLRRRTPDLPAECHLLLGHECTDLLPAAAAFRCYVGFAIRTEEPR